MSTLDESQADASATPALTRQQDSWTQRISGLTALPSVLRDLGVDPDALLARVGLPPDALATPDRRLPFAMLAQLLLLAANEAACPHLGLLVGRQWGYAATGLAGELAWRSATVREALETFTVYQRLNSSGGAAYFTRFPNVAFLGFAVYHPKVAQVAVVYDTAVAALTNAVRELCGPAWNPEEVTLPRGAPSDTKPYRDYFRCPVRFDAEHATLRIDGSILARPSPGRDATRKRELEREAADLGLEPLLPLVYRSLRLLMLDGDATANNVAQQFAMHRRTLDRRLRQHGRSFHEILSDVRYDVARHLLRDTQLSSAQIAAAIGFHEAASFTRAFRQWSGTTPARWRAGSHGEGGPLAQAPAA